MLSIDIDRVEIFAMLVVTVSIARYGTYLWSIYKKETKPHIFSWLNWGLTAAIGAYAQFYLNGGLSAWLLVMLACSCFFIAFIAFFVGTKDITQSDWIAFIGVLIAIPVWLITNNPIAAIIIIIVIDILSYYPTVRKSWHDPWGEPLQSYFWSGLRYFLILFTIAEVSAQNLFYPMFLMLSDWGFVAYIYSRRRLPRFAKLK